MDAERFDVLTRKLSSGQTRRRALGALGALSALWMQRGRAAQLGPPSCGDAGDVCTMLAGCCDGLTCVTSAINTNYGVCVSGGDGGTVASGTSLVSPFSESTQDTGTVDSTTTTAPTTTTSSTSTTSTISPQSERQARLQERRSRRSARRNKIQSRRNTKATTRKSRREDAREAEILAAGPELEFDYFVKSSTANGPQEEYEELRVTNASEFSVILTSVKLAGDVSAGTAIKKTLSKGGSLGLVSGRQNETGLSSDQQYWLQEDVCQNVPDPATRGWVVKAAFSGEAENRTYTIMCDGSVNGVPLDSDDDTSNNRRKKRKRKQEAAARRKKRKQNKKDR